MTYESWDDAIDRNMNITFNVTKEVMPFMVDAGYGRIVNVSSVTGPIVSNPGEASYSAAKAGVVGLSRALAIEFGSKGITVNCVAPGPTQTGWIDSEFEKQVVPLIPMGQLIQPEDISDTILFLASKRARMLTGQIIKVSGGHAL